MRKLTMEELHRKSVEEFHKASKNKIVVVLDNIRSMHNVGSVFRTSDAFLIESLFLCGYTPQPPHREINKTALGATETVNWEYFQTTVSAIEKLRKEGYRILAVEQTTDSIGLENYRSTNDKIAVIFGNEVEGVDESVLPYCDGCLEIPQLGMKHSLNISVAAGIVLWKLTEPLFLERGK